MNAIREGGILLLGAGGHAKSVVSGLLVLGLHAAGVLVDCPEKWGQLFQGVPILGPFSDLARYPNCSAVIAVGDNLARRSVADRFPEADWARVIFPQVYINPRVRIGPGTVVFPGAVIAADAILGAHVIVSAHTTVGHDTILEDYVQLAPGVQIAGDVHVGRGAMLGIGSIVCPKVRIGEEAVLAAGAVAVKDIPAGCKASGIPARPQ